MPIFNKLFGRASKKVDSPSTKSDGSQIREAVIIWAKNPTEFRSLAYLYRPKRGEVKLSQERLPELWSSVLIPAHELQELQNFVGKPSTWACIPSSTGVLLVLQFEGVSSGKQFLSFGFLRSEQREIDWLRALCDCGKVTVFSGPDTQSVLLAVTTALTVECAPNFSRDLRNILDSWV
jgi:hypothetical protein